MVTGGCQCGAIRYAFPAEAILTLYCCHCTECQAQSASAFGMSLHLPRTAFRLMQGSPATWSRPADSGGTNRARFCPDCGTRIFHDGGDEEGIVSLKAGSLDDTSRLDPVGHIWTGSAQPWVRLPNDLLIYERQPETDEALYAAWAARRAGKR